MATTLTKRLQALAACLLFLAAPTAHASPAPAAPAGAIPPVERATFHQLVFANEDVAVLNNLYPPGGDSGFHAHHRNLFAVIIQPQPSSSRNWGRTPI